MVYEICSPFIAKKIILEIYRAKEGQYLIQEKTPQTFEVVFKNNKDQQMKQRIVNTDLMTCTCLRKNYFGFPCAHLFAVLLQINQDICLLLPSLILEMWQIKYNFSHAMVKESTFNQMKIFKTPSKKNLKIQKENQKKIK